jgi:hypothetical protein
MVSWPAVGVEEGGRKPGEVAAVAGAPHYRPDLAGLQVQGRWRVQIDRGVRVVGLDGRRAQIGPCDGLVEHGPDAGGEGVPDGEVGRGAVVEGNLLAVGCDQPAGQGNAGPRQGLQTYAAAPGASSGWGATMTDGSGRSSGGVAFFVAYYDGLGYANELQRGVSLRQTRFGSFSIQANPVCIASQDGKIQLDEPVMLLGETGTRVVVYQYGNPNRSAGVVMHTATSCDRGHQIAPTGLR